MTIAVTGATGQLGRLVLEELLASQEPASLVAVVRDAGKAEELRVRGVQVRAADYSDPAALEAALAGVDKLLLVSGSEVGSRVAQHANVINAAKAAGVRFIAYTSVLAADTTELILAPEHKATEELIRESGLENTILRNGWYTENYVQAVTTARQTGAVVAAAGDGRVASAARADYAAAAAAVLSSAGHEGRVYELSGDYAWDFKELATALTEIAGREVVYQPVSAAELVEVLTSAGLDQGTAGFLAALDTDTQAGLLATVTGELSGLIGRPTTPLLQALRSATAS
ncbi:SDR family oxidoreductase [Arthrobacter sp. NicSoilB8]|uniref:SDR family oxidoreductase n=1 Tax=Arthrobacter sp. NicSoilB8 TaxID=2830998 RepID=UPI001CC785AE|nr:SDR family oxidoreductase [Arthrobacter sp. NicSoilB8]BCW71030.1 NAD(P)-dependent oxidoreductase [Arthrobacter sp. NicSoilB8]